MSRYFNILLSMVSTSSASKSKKIIVEETDKVQWTKAEAGSLQETREWEAGSISF